MLLKLLLSIDLVILLIDSCKFKRYIKWTILIKEFMSTQKSQSHKRQEQNNTEWLDELINKIESMKNKISNTY